MFYKKKFALYLKIGPISVGSSIFQGFNTLEWVHNNVKKKLTPQPALPFATGSSWELYGLHSSGTVLKKIKNHIKIRCYNKPITSSKWAKTCVKYDIVKWTWNVFLWIWLNNIMRNRPQK